MQLSSAPCSKSRAALRAIYASEGEIPEKVLHDDAYFSNFNLRLPSQVEGAHNPFNGLNYETLGDYKTTFDLRAIRSIVVKQSSPKNDQSSMYEIFDRLNTGGINLTPQEIRMSLYRSPFLDMLARVNVEPRWRNLLGTDELDLHMKDIEILLRGLAMLVHSDTYKPSLRRFLNGFALEARGFDQEQIESFQRLIEAFFEACGSLDKEDFRTRRDQFQISLFEAIFVAACEAAYKNGTTKVDPIKQGIVSELRDNAEFANASIEGAAGLVKVRTRLRLARSLV